MEERQPIEPEAEPVSNTLRPYHSPTLTAYGSVAKLTQGPGGSIPDGTSGMVMVDM